MSFPLTRQLGLKTPSQFSGTTTDVVLCWDEEEEEAVEVHHECQNFLAEQV